MWRRHNLALIGAMKVFVSHEHIWIGGLHLADVAKLPFDDNFFDIGAVIGVLKYWALKYIQSSLLKLHRVLKPQARMVVDIPDQEHPYTDDMVRLERYLGRPIIIHSRSKFEEPLMRLFLRERMCDSQVVLKCFVRAVKSKYWDRIT